ncbi:preprotein translocase, SecG subunit [Heyndrickxia coagulans]|jgi:preprotein translocase subunit SecG|uniref:Protein-export membrane protein SecG n=1 Tax=Heyndrickxia coagulans TaxID=1398 RepID=A0A133KBS2_HEYCO|nr:preprotein translocase subunit SecG [Heyndrickxia coagulans]KWZ76927.1 preprotein translocase, SecG subunit [Heyndrickxia coagulans]
MVHSRLGIARLRRCAVVHTLLLTLLIIDSILLIAVILLQPGKSTGLSGAISGGAEQLFGKQKVRGIDLILHRITIVLAVLFFLLAIGLAYINL